MPCHSSGLGVEEKESVSMFSSVPQTVGRQTLRKDPRPGGVAAVVVHTPLTSDPTIGGASVSVSGAANANTVAAESGGTESSPAFPAGGQ